MGLIAHKNTALCSREAVASVPAPEFTPTWHPHGHADVLTSVEDAIGLRGMEIVKSSFSMDKTGSNMFGVLELDKPYNGANLTVGVRNSINKAMSVGVCAGSRVFVCDNLAFSAEFVALRKHTSGLDIIQLRAIAEDAVGKVTVQMDVFSEWHTAMKEIEVRENPAGAAVGQKELVYDLLNTGAFAPSQFNKFKSALDTEYQLNGASLYAVHGAVTRMQRGYNLFTQYQRNAALNAVMLERCPLPKAEVVATEINEEEGA